jgi:hypothetical protein
MEMNDSSLNFHCPICGVVPNEECRLTTGALRFESHIERQWITQDRTPKDSLAATKSASDVPREDGWRTVN